MTSWCPCLRAALAEEGGPRAALTLLPLTIVMSVMAIPSLLESMSSISASRTAPPASPGTSPLSLWYMQQPLVQEGDGALSVEASSAPQLCLPFEERKYTLMQVFCSYFRNEDLETQGTVDYSTWQSCSPQTPHFFLPKEPSRGAKSHPH